jgi:hypothetical protein
LLPHQVGQVQQQRTTTTTTTTTTTNNKQQQTTTNNIEHTWHTGSLIRSFGVSSDALYVTLQLKSGDLSAFCIASKVNLLGLFRRQEPSS